MEEKLRDATTVPKCDLSNIFVGLFQLPASHRTLTSAKIWCHNLHKIVYFFLFSLRSCVPFATSIHSEESGGCEV